MDVVVDVPASVPLRAIRLELAGDVRDAVWTDVFDEGVRSFTDVLQHGGFGGDSEPAAAGEVEIAVESGARRYTIAADGAEAGACRVLLNMCLARSTWSAKLKRIAVVAAGRSKSSSAIVSAEALARQRYPRPRVPPPFPYEIEENVVTAGAVALRVKLTRPPEAAELERLSRVLASWVEVADGGYPDDGMEPEECVVDATELYERDSTTLEMRIRMFEAACDSWQAVVGILAREDPVGRLVREMIVEP